MTTHETSPNGRLRRARHRPVVLVLALAAALVALAGHQLAAGASETPTPALIACPRLAGPLPTVTIPRCPPPCPRPTVPTTAPTAAGGIVIDPIVCCRLPFPTVEADPGPVFPCPRPTTTTGPPTTTVSTISVDGFAIAGVTENQVCTGPPQVEGCQSAFEPASDRVVISRDGQVVASTVSDAQGNFRVPVGPGTYEAQAALRLPGLDADCPAQTVVVSGPPVPHLVTLRCTVQGP
jgi:hypothetical protein